MNDALLDRIQSCERALSLTQPWGWCIVSMPGWWKDVENRKPGFSHKSFRGDFFVHAASSCTTSDYAHCRTWVTRRFGPGSFSSVPPRVNLALGGIIGMVRAVDLLPPDGAPRAEWHMSDQYGFVLQQRADLPFVKCKGALGFWKVGPDLKEQILRAARGRT